MGRRRSGGSPPPESGEEGPADAGVKHPNVSASLGLPRPASRHECRAHLRPLGLERVVEQDPTLVPVDDDPEAIDIRYPETDSELELALDIIEERVIETVTIADTAQSRLIRTSVTRRVTKMRSFRYVLPEAGVKLHHHHPSLTLVSHLH